MTNEEFEELVTSTPSLTKYLERAVRLKTRIDPVREDCMQEALLRICFEDAGLPIEHYKEVGRMAIHMTYMREWRYWQSKKRLRRAARHQQESMADGDNLTREAIKYG